MSLRVVPFNAKWITSEKIDIHAIYRRPCYVTDEYGELQRELDANGLPRWDLTGGLPVKQHNIWAGKGFEYVTLANRNSLRIAWINGTLPPGTHYRDFDQHPAGGPWNYRLYAEGQTELNKTEAAQLRDDLARFGPEAVEALRQRSDPSFRLPTHLKQSVTVAEPDRTVPSVEVAPTPTRRKPGRKPKAAAAPEGVPA